MRTIKGACCLLLGVGIIITAFVSAIAEGDPVAWVIPAGVALGLLSLWLAKVGRDHPSGHPYKAAPCYRLYAYGVVAVFVPLIGVIVYVAITSGIINLPPEPHHLWGIGIVIEVVIIVFTVYVLHPIRRHDDFDKHIKVLREMKKEKHQIYTPYDTIVFELERAERIQKEHLDKEVINHIQMRDGVSYLHARFCKRSRRE